MVPCVSDGENYRIGRHKGLVHTDSVVKNLPVIQETWVQSLGWKNPLEKEKANYSSILPQKSTDRGAWWATVHGVAKSQTPDSIAH